VDHKALYGNNEVILVVDDEPEILSVVEGILEKFKYRVICVNTFTDGIKYFQDHKQETDLILMDYTVVDLDHEMTAIQAIAKFKEEDPDIKIVVMSGHIIKDDEGDLSKDLDVQRIIAKPFNFEELTKLIKEVLEN
jgi:CheY-like chemotaxis protein